MQNNFFPLLLPLTPFSREVDSYINTFHSLLLQVTVNIKTTTTCIELKNAECQGPPSVLSSAQHPDPYDPSDPQPMPTRRPFLQSSPLVGVCVSALDRIILIAKKKKENKRTAGGAAKSMHQLKGGSVVKIIVIIVLLLLDWRAGGGEFTHLVLWLSRKQS